MQISVEQISDLFFKERRHCSSLTFKTAFVKEFLSFLSFYQSTRLQAYLLDDEEIYANEFMSFVMHIFFIKVQV